MATSLANSHYEVRRAHFIDRAKAIWDDAFDYTDMQFTTTKEPCIITCRKHGPIRIGMAQNHIMKNEHLRTGCPYCKEEQTGIFNYRQVPDKAHERKVKREAQLEAERKAKAAVRKQKEEQKCIAKQQERDRRKAEREAQLAAQKAELERQKQLQAEERKRKEEERIRKRTTDLIAKAIEVHGNKYDYTKTTYEKKLYHGKLQYVLANIYCPTHGFFDTRADVHIQQGCGCALCAGVLNNLSAEERKQRWLDQCHERFGDRFDYSQVEYVNNDSIVKIYCKEHDYLFETTPDTHVRGYGGCPLIAPHPLARCISASGLKITT